MSRFLTCAFLFFATLVFAASFQVWAAEPYDPAPVTQYVQPFGDPAAQAQRNAQQATAPNPYAPPPQRMTGTQDFILKLTAIVMPLLIAMMTGLMLYIQIKQKALTESHNIQQRQDLILVARSINGMKTQLVAKAELAAFLEALQIEGNNSPLSPASEQRIMELIEAARHADQEADSTASDIITQLQSKKDKA